MRTSTIFLKALSVCVVFGASDDQSLLQQGVGVEANFQASLQRFASLMEKVPGADGLRQMAIDQLMKSVTEKDGALAPGGEDAISQIISILDGLAKSFMTTFDDHIKDAKKSHIEVKECDKRGLVPPDVGTSHDEAEKLFSAAASDHLTALGNLQSYIQDLDSWAGKLSTLHICEPSRPSAALSFNWETAYNFQPSISVWTTWFTNSFTTANAAHLQINEFDRLIRAERKEVERTATNGELLQFEFEKIRCDWKDAHVNRCKLIQVCNAEHVKIHKTRWNMHEFDNTWDNIKAMRYITCVVSLLKDPDVNCDGAAGQVTPDEQQKYDDLLLLENLTLSDCPSYIDKGNYPGNWDWEKWVTETYGHYFHHEFDVISCATRPDAPVNI